MKIEKLQASSVRGLPRSWPELQIGDKGIIIRGDNGVGKSSILDALEFILTGKSTLFADNRSGGVNWESAAPHVNDGQPDIILGVKDSGTSKSISANGSNPALTPEGQEWTELARKSTFVLRRHMLLDFVTRQASGRYSLLEPFFNMDGFSPFESALNNLATELKTQSQQLSGEITGKEYEISAIFQYPAELSETALRQKIEDLIAATGFTWSVEDSNYENVQHAIDVRIGGEDTTEKLLKLRQLKQTLARINSPRVLSNMTQNCISALEELNLVITDRKALLSADFLHQGEQAISSSQTDDCPLCEQPIIKDAVLTRIKERLSQDQNIESAHCRYRQTLESLQMMLNGMITNIDTFLSDWRSAGLSPLPASWNESFKKLQELQAVLAENFIDLDVLKPYPAVLEALLPEAEASATDIDSLTSAETGGGQRNMMITLSSNITAFNEKWLALATKKEELQKLTEKHSVILKILDHSTNARKEAIQKVLNEVCELANTYYNQIHPDEKIARTVLTVKQTGTGSVDMEGLFYNKRAHPMKYFSESHQDTLGLCYLLAFRRREATLNPRFKILLLDDVMHSVDASHRVRVAKLLKEHFSDHQLIITTHDGSFYDMLRHELGSSGYKYIRLTKWDINRGPLTGDPSTDMDRILSPEVRELLNASDVSNSCGRFFEWLLMEVSEKLRVPLQARFSKKHDIGSMWPAVRNKFEKGIFKNVHGDLTDRLHASTWIRNYFAHHNSEPVNPADSEAQEFADLLAEFYRAAHCDICNDVIAYVDDNLWHCTCGGKRYPLLEANQNSQNETEAAVA